MRYLTDLVFSFSNEVSRSLKSIQVGRFSVSSPIVTWLLTLISGAVGGNIGGALIFSD